MADSDADRRADASETFALRRGGRLALGDDGIYLDRPDEETVRVDAEHVVEVQYENFDYFLGLLSLSLVAFGLYSTTKHVLGGLAFAAAGVGSFYLTYRKRGKLTFMVSGRAKPLVVHPEHPEAAYEALRPLMDTGSD
ncbi:MAG: hypothetical protein ABEJ88_08560 [Halobacterium sp.]